MYKRLLKAKIEEKFFQGKAIILTGPRQTGKTTLAMDILNDSKLMQKSRIFNCDDPLDRELLSEKNLEFLTQLIGDAKVIFIDEGQKVGSIGQTTKLLVDYFKKEKQIFITGSSTISLLNNTEESLTGRKYVYSLFPLSLEELYPEKNVLTIIKNLESLLIFGTYPDIMNQKSFDDKREVLKTLMTSHLYKDILELSSIKRSDTLHALLKALALQIGSEVSLRELSSLIGVDIKGVEKLIDLLEKSYIIFRLSPYTKNKRREISKLKKIYFYDVGIRNAIINNFNFLDERNDVGALWENFLMVERLKYQSYHHIYVNNYFWRTYDGSEVDLIEERDGKLYGYELKWNEKDGKKKAPEKWLEYPKSSYEVITKLNLKNFVL